MLAVLAALLLAGCSAPGGTAALLARPERVIVLGEFHGTVETPAAFAGLICQAAEAGPVIVALEYPTAVQPLLDSYLAAPDDVSSLAALADSGLFAATAEDGRGSRAMLAVLGSVRALRQEGRDVTLHAFKPDPPDTPGLDQSWYELEMGNQLAEAVRRRPEARMLALVGSLHARKTPYPGLGDVGVPAAGHLPRNETLTLNVASQGGQAWDCQADGCGVHGGPGRADTTLRGVILEPTPDGAYDGYLAVGQTTASPPAALSAVR
jgi:hypothetical protein